MRSIINEAMKTAMKEKQRKIAGNPCHKFKN